MKRSAHYKCAMNILRLNAQNKEHTYPQL
uniref:Uncharacterized protein n=1 Tax=Anguilla anguilla TaxID=7936 RepID=A0A0E9XBG4_ANGAN